MLAGEVREGIPWHDGDPYGLSPEQRARFGPPATADTLWRLLGNLQHQEDQITRNLRLLRNTITQMERAHSSVAQWDARDFLTDAIQKGLTLTEKWEGFQRDVIREYTRRAIDPDSGGFVGENEDEDVAAEAPPEGGGAIPDPGGNGVGDGAAGGGESEEDHPAADRREAPEA